MILSRDSEGNREVWVKRTSRYLKAGTMNPTFLPCPSSVGCAKVSRTLVSWMCSCLALSWMQLSLYALAFECSLYVINPCHVYKYFYFKYLAGYFLTYWFHYTVSCQVHYYGLIQGNTELKQTLNQRQSVVFQDILVLYKIDGILQGSGKRRYTILGLIKLLLVFNCVSFFSFYPSCH